MDVIATTTSSLSAGMFRFQHAAGRIAQASLPASDSGLPVLAGDPAAGVPGVPVAPLSTYDFFGRAPAASSSDDLVGAVADLLSAQHDVEINVAVLKRAHEMQGSLLDVLA